MPFFGSPFRKTEAPAVVTPEQDVYTPPCRPLRGRLGSIEAIDLEITVIQGQGLTPKDRGFFGLGRLSSSDPYVKVLLVQQDPPEEASPVRPNSHSNNNNPRMSQKWRQWSSKRNTAALPRPASNTQLSTSSSSDNSSHKGIHRVKLGRTRTIYKTLHPYWNETICGSIRGQQAVRNHTAEHPAVLEFHIIDEDQLSSNDAMGMIRVTVPLAHRNVDTTEWYEVPPHSADKAQGRLQIRIQTRLRWSHILVRGNTFDLTPSMAAQPAKDDPSQEQAPLPRRSLYHQEQSSRVIQLGLSWDVMLLRQVSADSDDSNGVTITRKAIDLDASCVAVSHTGQVIMPDTVYYGNLTNSNGSVWHSGDDRTGERKGDDETITLQLHRVPNHVMAMYLIVTVATPNMTLAQVQSTRVTVRDVTPDMNHSGLLRLSQKQQQHTLCMFTPSSHSNSRDATAMFMLRIARDPPVIPPAGPGERPRVSKRWVLVPIEDTHPTARDFGSLIPHVKAYSRDLVAQSVPDMPLRIDPTERVAVLRKGGSIRIQDYCPGNALPPSRITFGLSWDVTNGENIDLDASAICLDKHLNLIDMVWWKQLHSKDYNIVHHGDERFGVRQGDDELIDLYLHNMTLMGEHCHVEYIGFVVNSYSGQKLKDVNRASCHLFDPETNFEMATYALTNSQKLDGVTALLVGCLYRAQAQRPIPESSEGGTTTTIKTAEGEWCFTIISEPSDGRTVKHNVEGFRNYLKQHPLQPAPAVTTNQSTTTTVLDAHMPPFVPLAQERVAPSPLMAKSLGYASY